MNLENTIKEIKSVKKLMQQQAQNALKNEFSNFFKKHKMAKKIVWTQYTPYFNDGDACEFTVGNVNLGVDLDCIQCDILDLIKSDYEKDVAYKSHSDAFWQILPTRTNKKYYPELKDKFRQWNEDEKSLMDDFASIQKNIYDLGDFMYDIFNDHVMITATIDGFEIEEYEHE